jgi:hypothetical protein
VTVETDLSSLPQSWDPHAIRVAVARIQGLVDGFVSDFSGAGFRREVESVIGEAIDSQEDIALLLYGAAILGAASLALASELGHESHTEVRAMTGQAVNTWLDGPLSES